MHDYDGDEEEGEKAEDKKLPPPKKGRLSMPKGTGLRSVIAAATRKNLGKDAGLGFISTMDAEINQLGQFNSDLSKFLEGIEARITGEDSESHLAQDCRGRRSSSEVPEGELLPSA